MPTLKGTEVSLSYVQRFLYLLSKYLYFSHYVAGCLLDTPRTPQLSGNPPKSDRTSYPKVLYVLEFNLALKPAHSATGTRHDSGPTSSSGHKDQGVVEIH